MSSVARFLNSQLISERRKETKGGNDRASLPLSVTTLIVFCTVCEKKLATTRLAVQMIYTRYI